MSQPMTVARLQQLLAVISPSTLVVMASDPEGNDFGQWSGRFTHNHWDARNRELTDRHPDDLCKHCGHQCEDSGECVELEKCDGSCSICQPKNPVCLVLWP